MKSAANELPTSGDLKANELDPEDRRLPEHPNENGSFMNDAVRMSEMVSVSKGLQRETAFAY